MRPTKPGIVPQNVGRLALRWEAMRATLDERGRRRWCAAEARSHGRGGIAVVAGVTGVSRRTIDRGLVELEAERAGEREPLLARRCGERGAVASG